MTIADISKDKYFIHNKVGVTITPSNANAKALEITATHNVSTHVVQLFPINNIFEFDLSVLAKVFFTYENILIYDETIQTNKDAKLIVYDFKIHYASNEETQIITKTFINGYNQLNEPCYLEDLYYKHYKIFLGYPISLPINQTLIQTETFGYSLIKDILNNQINVKYEFLENCKDEKDIYVKWLNPKGYYSYWLFKNKIEKQKDKSIGLQNRYFHQQQNETSNVNSLGFNSEIEYSCFEIIEKKYWEQIKSLYNSREVYILSNFENEVIQTDWIKVLPSGNMPKLEYRFNKAKFEFQYTMPNQYTNAIW